jgi:hypothetical protein
MLPHLNVYCPKVDLAAWYNILFLSFWIHKRKLAQQKKEQVELIHGGLGILQFSVKRIPKETLPTCKTHHEPNLTWPCL